MAGEHLLDACVFKHCAADSADAVALRCEQRSLTYGELARRISWGIRGFKRNRVPPGCMLFFVVPDSIDFAVYFLAAMGAGACPVPISADLGFEDLALLVGKFKPHTLATSLAKKEALRDLRRVSPDIRIVALESLDATSAEDVDPALEFSEYSYGLLTSGTTGIPKLIRRRHDDIVIGWRSYACHLLKMDARDSVYSSAPFCFGYGLGSGLLFPLLSGATAAVSSAQNTSLARDLARSRPTLVFSQPRDLNDLLNSRDEIDLSSVRITVSAGEPIPEHLPSRWLARFGHPIVDGYGTTEVGHIFISQSPENRIANSVGRPVPGFRVDVIDQAGVPRSPNEPGVLRVKVPGHTSSYFLDETASGETFVRDAILTVDLATMSEQGDVFILGRVTDFAVLPNGEVINLSSLDGRLLALPFVKDGYVVQAKSINGSAEIALAVVVALKQDIAPSQKIRRQVCDALSHGLDEFAPGEHAIQFVERISRNSHGKLVRSPSQLTDVQFKC